MQSTLFNILNDITETRIYFGFRESMIQESTNILLEGGSYGAFAGDKLLKISDDPI